MIKLKLPEKITLEFKPVDNGNIYDLEIETEYEKDREVIADMILLAYQELSESLEKEK